MKLSVLVDNNTLIDRYFFGEPGVSYLIEDSGKQILFDTGYSNAFIINAQKLGINLLKSDFVVLSHGHLDHTWGLDPLIKLYLEAITESLHLNKPTIIAHQDVFNSKSVDQFNEIGSIISIEKLRRHFNLNLTNKPYWLTDKLVFLGEIKRSNNFENKNPVGKVHNISSMNDDYLLDDTALAYKGEKGLTIITGCSHSGICNIIEHAKHVCKENRIYDVIGGFHLMNPKKEVLDQTIKYFSDINSSSLHACHCTDLKSKIAISKVANLQEVGVGLTLEYK